MEKPKGKKKAAKIRIKPVGRIKVVKVTPKGGQDAGELDLPRDCLNAKEVKVLEALASVRGSMTLAELAKAAFPRLAKARGNSWVRNSLRRLVRAAWVVKVEPGVYKVSPKGRSGLPSRPLEPAPCPKAARPDGEVIQEVLQCFSC